VGDRRFLVALDRVFRAITLIELRNNPLDDTERREWTNKMLYYGLACVFGFIIACLYLPALYFAP
jgi:hypothetical protein